MVNSFKSPLPWTQCGQSWNTDKCVAPEGFRSSNGSVLNATMAPMLLGNFSEVSDNTSAVIESSVAKANESFVLSTDEFWQ